MAVVVPLVSALLAMPIIGYGTWQSSGEDLVRGLETALGAGYRHIDTASVYGNERVIGDVLQAAMEKGSLRREELFVVSKLPVQGMRPSGVVEYLERSLKDLRLDYLDLYLVHVPFGFVDGRGPLPLGPDGTVELDVTTDHLAIWKAMEETVKSGKVKAIGLSNFNSTQIQNILDNCSIPPKNLQVEMHLYHQQEDLRQFCSDNNITLTAYSPLGSRGSREFFTRLGQTRHLPDLFAQPLVQQLAAKYSKSPSQVLLKHLISKGVAVIPKSTSPEHIRQNIDILDFQLTPQEMQQLDSLDQGGEARIVDFKFLKGVENHPQYPF